MIASCHRRTGNYTKALEVYKRIHTLFPDNVECETEVLHGRTNIYYRTCSHHSPSLIPFSQGLKYLVRLCTDMDLPEAQEYAIALKKAESNLERRESVSGPIRPVCICPI